MKYGMPVFIDLVCYRYVVFPSINKALLRLLNHCFRFVFIYNSYLPFSYWTITPCIALSHVLTVHTVTTLLCSADGVVTMSKMNQHTPIH